jgi:hypothetical protein
MFVRHRVPLDSIHAAERLGDDHVNKLNLVKLKKYGVLAEITSTQAGHPVLAINLPAKLGSLGFAGAPTPAFEVDEFSTATAHLRDDDLREFKERDESVAAVVPVTTALAKQAAKVVEARSNTNLSVPGVLKIAVAALEASLTTMGTQFAKLTTAIKPDLQRQYDQLYAVPRPDAVEVVEDVEIRSYFRSLSAKDQHLRALKVGDEPRLLFALKRTPVPLDDQVADLVRDAWVNAIALRNADKAATLKLAMDCNEWAVPYTKYIASFAASASLSGTSGAVDRFSLYQILKPTGGLAVLNFTDHEIAIHERRLQQAAA